MINVVCIYILQTDMLAGWGHRNAFSGPLINGDSLSIQRILLNPADMSYQGLAVILHIYIVCLVFLKHGRGSGRGEEVRQEDAGLMPNALDEIKILM